jgi:O-antigen/teichoic acid export membrane protein
MASDTLSDAIVTRADTDLGLTPFGVGGGQQVELPRMPFSGVLLRWTAQGFWAVLDQALFAVSNLILNVLLARWLPPADYGAFATAFTVLLLVSVAHTAFLSEPMLVFGSDRYLASFSDYLRVLQKFHWRLMIAFSVALALVAVALQSAGLTLFAQAVAGLTIAAPCILLSWLCRRACYPVGRPRWAALAGLLNLMLIAVGALVLSRMDLLTVFSAQLLTAVAALCASAGMSLRLGRITTAPLRMRHAAVWRDHWRYGRWSGAAGAFNWFQGYIYYFLLPIWGGLAAAGALKALLNLVMPILQSDGALSTLLMPQFAKSRRMRSRFRLMVFGSAFAFILESCVYWLALVLIGPRLLQWIYGGVYRYSPQVIAVLGLVPLLSGVSNILANTLRAREQPEGLFWANVASVLSAGTIGTAAVALKGVEGAILGMVCGSAAQVAVMLWLLGRPSRLA